MNKLKINGYRLYGDFELVLVEPTEEIISAELKKYVSAPRKTIELRCNNCKFNKGKQEGKNIKESISVVLIKFNGDKYDGEFLVQWLTVKDKISFSAVAIGAITFTPGNI